MNTYNQRCSWARNLLIAACTLLCSQFSNAGNNAPFIHILGVTQDAGYPQIGCYRPHCMPGWKNVNLQRGAVSLGVVDPKSKQKYLFEATPALPSQLFQLHSIAPDEVFSLRGIFLTHAHIGHYTGLMYLGHEALGSNGIPVYAMPRMRQFLSSNGPWSQLVKFNNITIKPLAHKVSVDLGNVTVTPFLVPHRDEFSETVGFRIVGPNRSAIFIPDINKWEQWSEDIVALIKDVDYALLDAAFYADGELPGRDMSKIPHPFVSESMALFDLMPIEQRNRIWFIHMNHSNPMLQADSPESQLVRKKGYRIAQEGIQLGL